MAASRIKQLVHLDGFWAGDAGPAIPITFARTNGGYRNCTDLSGNADTANGIIRVWNPERSSPVGVVIASALLTPVDPVHGKYLFDWTLTTAGTVPLNPGMYVLQVSLTPHNVAQRSQFSQRAIFEVLASSPAS